MYALALLASLLVTGELRRVLWSGREGRSSVPWVPGTRSSAARASPSACFPGSAWPGRAVRRRRSELVPEGTCSRFSENPSGDDSPVRGRRRVPCVQALCKASRVTALLPGMGVGGGGTRRPLPLLCCPCPGVDDRHGLKPHPSCQVVRDLHP